jgi:NAD(P)-dependent dehydrogenase (short-subunit alcohol dehydrogenase family)
MSLREAHIVVVGGTSGMGLEIARSAAEHGARVTAVGKTADRVRTAQSTLGSAVTVRPLDMADEPAVREFFSGMGSIDHLVITATGGAHRFGRVGDTPIAEIRSLFENRFWGTYNVVHHAAPLLRSSGSVTLFSGTAAVRAWGGASILSAALAAVEALGRALAVELAPVRVNVVRPGSVDTPLLRAVVPPDFEAYSKSAGAALPARRIGTTADVAHAVLFLMTNGFTTGSVLGIDGGGLVA